MARAERLCEYFLIAEADTFYGCETDHIISEKHGGPTEADKLAYACVFCNQAKGSDIGSVYWESTEFVRFFNPRTDRWAAHFELAGNHINGLTAIGIVTGRILGFNTAERLMERQFLRQMGRYPSAAARVRMQV